MQHPGSRARAPLELTGLLRGYATLRRRVRREHWDIADWQSAPLPPFDIALLTAIRRHAGAVIFTMNDIVPTSKPWTVPLWGRVFRACDRVVVRSQHGKQKLLDQFGVMAEHVAVIPHALPLLTVPEPRVEPGVPAILFFGAIGADQGLDLLIEALPQVATAVPALQLLVVVSRACRSSPRERRRCASRSGSSGIPVSPATRSCRRCSPARVSSRWRVEH